MKMCSQLVLKSKRGGYKVYKVEAAGIKAGAKRCGGSPTVEMAYEDVWQKDGVWLGAGRYSSEFVGIDVKCSKCGSVFKRYGLDDLELLVCEQEGII